MLTPITPFVFWLERFIYRRVMEILYKMSFLQTIRIPDFLVTKVPGGWIFQHCSTLGEKGNSVFVPFCDERS